MTHIPSYLIDGRARAAAHPGRFNVPSMEEIANLKVGDYVRIGLEKPDGAGERFWARLAMIEVTEDEPRFIGIVSNDLLFFPEYPDQAPIGFLARHILGILT